MRKRALIVCVLAVAGCAPGGASPDGGDDAAGAGDGGPTYAPTYEAVYDEILSPNCALPFCHGGAGDYLQLSSADVGYGSLVGARAQGPLCSPTGLDRVDPGHPDRSLMFLKVTDPPCGVRMPLLYGYSGMLTDRQIDQIGQWIACGALPGDAGCPTGTVSFAWDGAVSVEASAEGGGDADATVDGGAADSPAEAE